MSALQIILAPLQDVRAAVWDRLDKSVHTEELTLAQEGVRAGMPYVAVGPAYKGSGGTDPEIGVNVAVQIDAFAETRQGGSHAVTQMQQQVAAALSEAPITVLVGGQASRALTITVEDDVINPHVWDEPQSETYAHRYIRYRMMITT